MWVYTFALCHSINLYDWFSPTTWILGLNPKLLDFTASVFTAEPSPWTLLSNLIIPSATLSSNSQTGDPLMTIE